MMQGPYGVVCHEQNSKRVESAEIEASVISQIHPMIKSLPGFRAVMYYSINDQDYYFVVSFVDEVSTDGALKKIRALSAENPDVEVFKAVVAPGNLVDRRTAVDHVPDSPAK